MRPKREKNGSEILTAGPSFISSRVTKKQTKTIQRKPKKKNKNQKKKQKNNKKQNSRNQSNKKHKNNKKKTKIKPHAFSYYFITTFQKKN